MGEGLVIDIPHSESAEFMAQTNILRVKLFQNNHYQTTRPFSGEIPAGRSFRRPYRKGSTCSHPEHRSQAFRADDSAYQRESRYCRIFKTPLLFTVREFFYALTPTTNTTASKLSQSHSWHHQSHLRKLVPVNGSCLTRRFHERGFRFGSPWQLHSRIRRVSRMSWCSRSLRSC